MSPENIHIAKEITIAVINRSTGSEVDLRNLTEHGEQVSQLFLTVCKAVDQAIKGDY